ncbi:MAG: hypothetical protein ACTSO9_16830, partial [Candidatus Helarchaeota archaeon]
DECHNNNVDFLNTEAFQVVLNRLEGVVFRLVQPPITYDNIQGEDLIILGCPTIKYSLEELDALEKFVENGKGIVLISGNGGDMFYNTNLSELGRRFEFEFNDDQVEDDKNNMGLSNVVRISQFDTIHFSENVHAIIYSGCSINILDDSCKPIARTNPDSVPRNTPIAVISGNNRVIGIGAFNLFIDHPEFGIEREQNLQFVLTIFDYLKNHIELEENKYIEQDITEKEIASNEFSEKEISIDYDAEQISELFIPKEYEIGDLDENVPVKDIDKVSPKHANEKFKEILSFYIKKLEEIEEQIDDFWLSIKKTVSKSLRTEFFDVLLKYVSATYQKFSKNIAKLAEKINEKYSLFCSKFSLDAFDYENALAKWFESEAECREKLDMIRNNLVGVLDAMKEDI